MAEDSVVVGLGSPQDTTVASPVTAPSSRLARLTRRGRSGVSSPELTTVARSIRKHHPKADLRDVQAAYDIAEQSHRGQTRRSGEAYITHPVEVAEILADLGMPVPVLVAALLHDTVEDTEYSLAELREAFGDEIADLVDGVTKLDKVKYGQAAQAETVRKMVVAMARDIRVLVIKLADRLHNMRTLGALPPE
jgi:guanosine-3',5'-bis(diphosphate) 3'-pyrophosphohydrolase